MNSCTEQANLCMEQAKERLSEDGCMDEQIKARVGIRESVVGDCCVNEWEEQSIEQMNVGVALGGSLSV